MTLQEQDMLTTGLIAALLPPKLANSDVVSFSLQHQSRALDEALWESFPASDCVAVSITRVIVLEIATSPSMTCL